MVVVEELFNISGSHFFVERNLLGVLRKVLCKVRSRVCGGHNSVKAIENKLHGAQHAKELCRCTARPDKVINCDDLTLYRLPSNPATVVSQH